MSLERPIACLCGAQNWETTFHYTAPPKGEIHFAFTAKQPYDRVLMRCLECGHFRCVHSMDMGALYAGAYNHATYTDLPGMRRSFARINELAPDQSDNIGRVQAVLEFAKAHHAHAPPAAFPPTILDVGTGLCVFLFRMKQHGWSCTALDPDEQAVRHAREVVGVEATHADFLKVSGLGAFDAITFNRVLEHVQDPISMLARAKRFLHPNGFVYIEVPDGEEAIKVGPNREEFFIDHRHAFSKASLEHLCDQAGFGVVWLTRLREPSSKFTLRAFTVPLHHVEHPKKERILSNEP